MFGQTTDERVAYVNFLILGESLRHVTVRSVYSTSFFSNVESGFVFLGYISVYKVSHHV